MDEMGLYFSLQNLGANVSTTEYPATQTAPARIVLDTGGPREIVEVGSDLLEAVPAIRQRAYNRFRDAWLLDHPPVAEPPTEG